MEDFTVRRLALVLAVLAEIESMKVENDTCRILGEIDKYGENSFKEKAQELRNLAYTHDLQLFG